MNTTSSDTSRLFTRRNFVTMSLIAAGSLACMPIAAHAAESDDLDAQADQLQSDLDTKQAEADAVAARLQELQDQYNDAATRYNEAIEKHDAAVAAMDQAQLDLDEAEDRVTETQDQLASRANAIYKNGNVSFVDVLFGSDSFDDFVNNYESMTRISQQDAELVQESKDAKADAQAARDEYANQEQIAADEMAAAKTAKDEAQAAQDSLQAEYDSMNEDIAAIQAQIEQVRTDAETARQREEEAAAAAAAAITTTSSSSTGSNTTQVSSNGWVNPAPGKYITSGFGWRPSIGDYHQGVDLSCRYEPVYCMADGTVTNAGWFGTGGLAVVVNHGGGVVSWYLHGSQIEVTLGQTVTAGQEIMISGSTGYSTGPHLHFQINVNSTNGVTGTAVNPTNYFSW
jgi:murein DD-endopeptidase MepM/ murein hydrolase activator NlpD